MSDLTAADLARIEALADTVVRLAALPAEFRGPLAGDLGRDVPALVAAVRELARAIIGAEWNGNLYEDDDEICPFCEEHWKNTPAKHAPDCIVHRARALVGEERDDE